MKTLLTALALSSLFTLSGQTFAHNQTGEKMGNVNAETKSSNKTELRKTGYRSVVGTVVDTTDISLKGVQGKHRLLRVETPQGKRVVVDMGETTKLGGVSIAKGERIFASGKAARIGGKPVIYARYVGELQPVGAGGMNK